MSRPGGHAAVIELHAAGKTEIVYERRRLEDVNPAIHEVETGQVKARLVFDLQ
jgi:alcohol dehydrogenase, propanol-preferring